MSGAATAERRAGTSRGHGRLIAVLTASVVGFAVQQTAIVPAVENVQRSLHASPEWAAWLVTVYLVVATVATVAMGRAADLYGRRRVLLVGLSIFAVSSVGAAVAPDIGVLLIFRAFQGAGGAVYPLTLSIAREQSEPDRVPRVIGMLVAAFGIGTAIGFVGGGVLAEYASWRYVFVAGAVLVAVDALLVHRFVPAAGDRAGGRFDRAGTVAMGAAAGALLVALTIVPEFGWHAPLTIGLLALSVISAAGWAALERRVHNPLIDLHVLAEPSVRIANLATIGLGWALFSSYLLVPTFARSSGSYGLGLGGAGVGLLLLPLAIAQLLAAPASVVLTRRWRAAFVYAAGLLLVAASLGLLCAVRASVWGVAGAVFLLGAGAGTALQASSATATEAVNADVAAVSTSLNSTVRRLAGGLGGQVSTILLGSLVAASATQPSFLAFQVSYLVAAGLCAAGVVPLLAHARRRRAAP